MKDYIFFKNYLPALEIALENDKINHGYLVKSYDWYIDDENIRNQMNEFVNNNYSLYDIFSLEDIYFDARSHEFKKVNGEDISVLRNKLMKLLSKYKSKYEINN